MATSKAARQDASESDQGVRVDKWLWAARLFKTRSQATTAVSGGKVHVDGQRIKPSRVVRIGQTLSITRGEVSMDVLISGLSSRRGPAPQAETLYSETEVSLARRSAAAGARRASHEERQLAVGRPQKRDRRQLAELKRGLATDDSSQRD